MLFAGPEHLTPEEVPFLQASVDFVNLAAGSSHRRCVGFPDSRIFFFFQLDSLESAPCCYSLTAEMMLAPLEVCRV